MKPRAIPALCLFFAASLLLWQCATGVPARGARSSEGAVVLRIFHTSDEHGWLKPIAESGMMRGGIANFAAWLKVKEEFDPEFDLLLSSGDLWSGPAITDVFKGEPAVAALNLLGYSVAALGNHEFDFGLDVLAARLAEAKYAPLPANIRVWGTGKRVSFAKPYVILTVQGVKVGVIGVTTTHTATASNPRHVGGLVFEDPAAAIEAVVPEVRAAGADVVVVLAHETFEVMSKVAAGLKVHVDAIFTGHDHNAYGTTVNGRVVTGSGSEWKSYSVTTLTIDRASRAVTHEETRITRVEYPERRENPVVPDPEVAAFVNGWQERLGKGLAKRIGYTASGIEKGSWTQANWVTDAWLAVIPDADVVVQNFGGLRQSVPPGTFTLETMIGMMPFDNRVYGVKVTGAQLAENLAFAAVTCISQPGRCPAVGGMSFKETRNGVDVTLKGGAPLNPKSSYRVLINDFMYAGGSGYSFGKMDPSPTDYGMNYRDPVVEWTEKLNTSERDPLEKHLDRAARNR